MKRKAKTSRRWISQRWLVLWSLWAARLVPQPTPPVHVESGLLQGLIAPDGSHTQYFGIPYADTSADGRFQISKPVPKWEGTFKAYNENIRCKQRFSATRISGQENCLTLNVYTPLQMKSSFPVMVFIHGGGFRDGSGSPFLYGPEYLIKHDVILVTINYRLEILGFLCLGIKDAPGNVGLKDQANALKWIKNNIKVFGGDPDNITIFGESAGSASVMYHILSPMSEGLFNKAILQSGSAMSPWSLQFEPIKTASYLAKQLGYVTEDPREIYEIFKTKTANKLLETRVLRKEGDIVLSENIFVPCVEKLIPDEERFLPDTPYNLLTNGKYNKVPIIIGFNNAEGYMFAGKENDTTISKLNFYDAIPRDLHFFNENERLETAKRLKEFYMGDKLISKDTMVEFSKFEGDSSITYPVIATIYLLLQTMDKNMYGYKFGYDGWMNLAKFSFGYSKYPGATHADELFYMFKIKAKLITSFFEMKFINEMTSMWTNFAKYGDPTPNNSKLPKWKPMNRKNPQLLGINTQYSVEKLWDDEVIRYWNETYTKYRRKS